MSKKTTDDQGSLSDLISISEAARVREVSHTAIQDLIKRGKLSSMEIGGRRFVSRSEVESYVPEPIGRPSTKKGSKQGNKK